MNSLKGNLLFHKTRGTLPGDLPKKYKKEI